MARSFFTGTDAELYTGSESFSTKISATPTAYGLTAAQASSYASLNSVYAASYMAAQDPETRTKGQVAAKNTARDNLRIAASDLAKIIDGTPSVTDQQKIDLGLNVRKIPSPMPPPGTPYQLKVELLPNGSLKLKWKCNNPAGSTGTLYHVYRKVGTAPGEFTFIGGSGARTFVDGTVPSGVPTIVYQVQAARTTAVGDAAEFVVNFGVGASGSMTASVDESPSAPKMAA